MTKYLVMRINDFDVDDQTCVGEFDDFDTAVSESVNKECAETQHFHYFIKAGI